jgi:predicted nucleotidyltransferase
MLNTFNQFPEIKEVKIFVSRAKSNYKNGSDIDLAISGERVDLNLIFKLKSLFNERLPIPYKVDAVGYDYLTHRELKDHIFHRGKVILSRR